MHATPGDMKSFRSSAERMALIVRERLVGKRGVASAGYCSNSRKKTNLTVRRIDKKESCLRKRISVADKKGKRDAGQIHAKDSWPEADVAENRTLCSHVTRQPIDKLAFLKDSNDKPPRHSCHTADIPH